MGTTETKGRAGSEAESVGGGSSESFANSSLGGSTFEKSGEVSGSVAEPVSSKMGSDIRSKYLHRLGMQGLSSSKILSGGESIRPILFRLHDQRKYLEKNIPGFDEFSLYYATRGSRAELIENLVRAAFLATFIEGQPMVRSEQAFEQRLEARGGLFEAMEQIAKSVAVTLKHSMKIQDQLQSLSVDHVVEDIRFQLDRLLPAGFPAMVPTHGLRQYPRYFRAIEQRMDRLGGNVDKDKAATEAVRAWWARLEAQDGPHREKLDTLRWMLEEYRVSLFAQSVGTPRPISDKRLRKEWESIMGLIT